VVHQIHPIITCFVSKLSRSLRAAIQINSFWRGSFFSFTVERLDSPKAEVIAEVRRRAGLDPTGRPSFRF